MSMMIGSPLVDPSEVNQVRLVSSPKLQQYFSHFKDQDVAMINMHDLSLPQQGGADFYVCSICLLLLG